MPKHHPHPHQQPHHGPEWIFNIHNIELSPEEIGEYIKNIGEKIKTNGRVSIEDNEVSFPSQDLELFIRHERTPKSDMLFKLEIKWATTTTTEDHPKTGAIKID